MRAFDLGTVPDGAAAPVDLGNGAGMRTTYDDFIATANALVGPTCSACARLQSPLPVSADGFQKILTCGFFDAYDQELRVYVQAISVLTVWLYFTTKGCVEEVECASCIWAVVGVPKQALRMSSRLGKVDPRPCNQCG